MKDDLKFIKPLAWEEVFNFWENNEADLERWIAHYKKQGFSSWRDWRTNTIKDLDLNKKEWKLYEVVDPLRTIPTFFGGPFRAWIKNIYNGKEIILFSEIIKNPQIQNKIKMTKIIENFPLENLLIGLDTAYGIVIIEGMHRCSAIALAAEKSGLQTKVKIALADFVDKKIPLLGNSNSPT